MTYFRSDLRPSERFHLHSSDTPGDLTEAYDLLRRLDWDWRGWKLGGSNHATRAAFGVSTPYFGPLHASEILYTPEEAPLLPLCEMKGEVEIALRIDATGSGYDAWCVALEMPASAIENLPAAGVAALVADRCGAGALLLGRVRSGALPAMDAARFALLGNGVSLSEAGPETLSGPPPDILRDFLESARALGFSPSAGDWVATGGITSCCDFAEGDRVTVTLNGIPELDFRVRTS